MKIVASRFALLYTASLLLCSVALAHHSMSMYDREHETAFQATIVQFNWENPHCQIVFTAPDDQGKVIRWTAEGPGPNRLSNHGWSKDTLKSGDQVTLVGNLNKDGGPTLRFVKVTLANGQTLEAFPRYY